MKLPVEPSVQNMRNCVRIYLVLDLKSKKRGLTTTPKMHFSKNKTKNKTKKPSITNLIMLLRVVLAASGC